MRRKQASTFFSAAPLPEALLHAVEERPAHQRLVAALEQLSLIADHPAVEGVAQQVLQG